ncbi:MAG: hypothetical protein NTZ95_01675 [Candidatus Omnitrophica bacterium]|nr:hypothetical protein [Candidatus Omnitrophota bacterium]
MSTSILKMFIRSNNDFFSKNSIAIRGKRQGKILVDIQTTDIFTVSTVMKIASAVSDVLNREMIVISAIKARGALVRLIKSYDPSNVINAKHLISHGFLFNMIRVLKLVMNVRTGDDLVSLVIQDMPVGIHIYDSILIRMGLSSVKKLSLRQRFYILMEVSFFYSILAYINRHNISYVILPDNAYRQGVVSEILKSKAIPSISGIDINGISMHKYESAEDYLKHCRAPDTDIVYKISNTPELYLNAENYLLFRTLGQEQQHDTMRAYSKDKMEINRPGLISTYKLHPGKKIILIMAHIFCDAPHAYPKMLFKDYEDWLIKTCFRLANNTQVNFLVKEHPSAALYSEEGKIDRMLIEQGFGDKLLSKDVNTKSLFNSVDAIVTCGGTAGMEFPCYGVPVLVAAKPSYDSFSYIVSPDTETAYYSELDKMNENEKLSDNDIKLAKSVLYTIHSVIKIEKDKIGLGSQQYIMGGQFDIDLFMEEMIADCADGKGYSAMISEIGLFLLGKHKNLIDHSKLSKNVSDKNAVLHR